MKYDRTYFPTVEEVNRGRCYIAIFKDDISNDGEAGTYDEMDFDNYEEKVLEELGMGWTTEVDSDGVYVVEDCKEIL